MEYSEQTVTIKCTKISNARDAVSNPCTTLLDCPKEHIYNILTGRANGANLEQISAMHNLSKTFRLCKPVHKPDKTALRDGSSNYSDMPNPRVYS